jgi:hypothetical protein
MYLVNTPGWSLQAVDFIPTFVISIIWVKVLEVYISPYIRFIKSASYCLCITHIHSLNRVSFIPGLLEKRAIILDPGVIGVYITKFSQYFEVKKIVEKANLIHFHSLVVEQ